MLSEEEKKAIERLEKRIKDNEDYKTTQVWLTDDIVAVDTVLNLITKLQKENEEKDKQIAKYEKIYKEYDCYRWVKEIEKKDKIIDLMAKAFKQDDVRSVEEIKQYFERKSES